MAKRKPQTETQLNCARMLPEAVFRKRSLRKSATPAEIEFRRILNELRINHHFQKLVFTEHRYFVIDFVIWQKPYCFVELYGSAHDGREAQDRTRIFLIEQTKAYKNKPIQRFRNEQVFSGAALEWLKARYPKQWARWGEGRTRGGKPPEPSSGSMVRL